jgi:chromosomal replication initiator protein
MKSVNEIIEIVSKETSIPVAAIKNPSRKEEIILARHLSMWASRWYTPTSMQKIAAAHGKRNHGTVINACTSIDAQATYKKSVKELCDKIVNQINNL